MIIINSTDKVKHIIKKYKNSDELFGLNYNGVIYMDNKIHISSDIDTLLTTIMILNRKDIKKRYSFIYDYMCDYLDIQSKVCDFKCDKCLANRLHKSVHNIDGCCYKNGSICPYLKGKCTIKSISCKLFMCSLVEHKYSLKSNINNYPFLAYFFNHKQQDIITYSFRQDKEEVINNLLKYSR